ncbi:MAG: hypothetical protein U9M90_03475 [Patescibacteria group bacterium]|nr:hypothetical protein [Patescibacteria group bacterium]
MNLMDFLHKFGIARDRKSAWKESKKDHRIQTAEEKAQDEKKGFIDKEFSRRDETAPNPLKRKKGKILFWIMSVIGFLTLLVVFNARDFSIWFIVLLSLWSAYLFNIRHSISIGTFIFSKMFIFGIIVFLLSVMIIATVLPS